MGSHPNSISYDDILSTLVELAKGAGKTILTTHPPTSLAATGTKKNSADLVTETDQAVEQMISRTLMAKYPLFKFMGEETYKPGMKLGPEPTFVVDPIDGTTNFVHGHPYVSVSLGFSYEREAKVGVVFNPFTGLMYWGIKGEGSYKKVLDFDWDEQDWVLKKEKVRLPIRDPQPLDSLDGTMVAIEWGSDRSGNNWRTKTKTWDNLGRSKEEGGAMVHSARALGSAALNLCAVAEGHLDLYWEGGCWAWDVCAGWVVLTEAGGMIVDGNPGTWDIPLDNRKYLAVRAAPDGQKKVIQEFWNHIDGEMEYEH